jgi:hypothetical protein
VRVVILVLLALAEEGCNEGCLGSGTACVVPSPCGSGPLAVAPTCTDASLELRMLDVTDVAGMTKPGGAKARGAAGDVLLGNSRVSAVVAGLGDQRYLDPNGGALIDLAPKRGSDAMSQALQATGILPEDTPEYTAMRIFDERPTRVAVQLDGTLLHRPDLHIHTLYEVRPCEPGVRVRTEVINDSPDPMMWAVADGWYWALRALVPFTPSPGAGFNHPSFTLVTINEAYASTRFLVGASPSAPSSYGEVACGGADTEGFQSEVVSSFGLDRSVVEPRDYRIYQRFIAVADGGDVAGAADILGTLLGGFARVSGSVDRADGVSIQFAEGTSAQPESARTPWSQVRPDASGQFSVELPKWTDYVIEVQLYGRTIQQIDLPQLAGDQVLAAIATPPRATLTLDAGGLDAELFFVPADDATAQNASGQFHGHWDACTPLLGPPHGGSPACNRALISHAAPTKVTLAASGRYFVYAYHGPFWTLQQKTVDASQGDQTISFKLDPLALAPAGTLSADLHVHGAASMDSAIPDGDRVLAFAAADVDVIAATDHDVVTDYGAVMDALGLSGTHSAIVGIETTGEIPWMKIPGSIFPLVIGHYNFWPLRYQPGLPRNGGPADEFVEPGELFDRIDPLASASPIYQLNHPWAAALFGRDLGFPRALSLDCRKDLPAGDDGSSGGMYVRAPKGGHVNDGQTAQEVMNGTNNDTLLAYRAFWWFVLNQGKLVAGTANSDSHGLTDQSLGSPRNLVTCSTKAGKNFDIENFDDAVRAGHVLGTNGPIIVATVDGQPYGLAPLRSSAMLHVEVDAAPWIPVEEVRIVVNGRVVKTLGGLAAAPDPFGKMGLVRGTFDVPLDGLLPPSGDAWLVVEAGMKLLDAADLGGGLNNAPDGIPDTTDNNGDGKIDQSDVAAGESIGPLRNIDPPKDPNDPLFHFAQVVPGAFPFAFTNPFVFDRDGNGKFDAPGVTGGWK